MAGKGKGKGKLSIPWPFEGMTVRLNTDTGLLKLIAIIAMLTDHACVVLFPRYRIPMRVIGRLAFPIFAYCLAVGSVYTKNMARYVQRILLMALISQPLYALALDHGRSTMLAVSFSGNPLRAALDFYVLSFAKPSILLSLAVGLIVLWSIRDRQLIVTASMLLFSWVIQGKLDYGFNGIVLMVLFFLFCSAPLVSLPVVGGFMVWWGLRGSEFHLFGVSFGMQMFAVLSLPLIYIRMRSGMKLNKWVFYLFYPAHLVLLYVLEQLPVFR